MEGDDDEEISVVAEESEKVATVISNALNVDRLPDSSLRETYDHRLCQCRLHIELGRMALMLGKRFWVPLIHGQHSGTGSPELTILRTFFLSSKGRTWFFSNSKNC